MKRLNWLLILLLMAGLALPACRPAPRTDLLYLALMWHQHQPLYYREPASGVYSRPWVRVHATKDYYDMAAMLESYPNVHVTFNLTPVLMRQLDDLAAGAKDVYWTMAEKPAAELTEDDKRFILTRFFDANLDHIIRRFPRYSHLYDKRGGTSPDHIEAAVQSFSQDELRDLQIWFNLAWFDPDLLAQAPLQALVARGRDFSEADKKIVFDKALAVIREVLPVHKRLQDKGQIEVSTTPYAHPILPLVYDTNLARVGNAGGLFPKRFSYPNDAIAHLNKSVEIYKAHLGRAPRGLWPGEGAVAQEVVKLVADAGYGWMASGELVLAKSLGQESFTRNSADTVQEADGLYRPYALRDPSGAQVAMLFRDLVISDKIGFTYSGMPADAAADDVMKRLEAIRAQLKASGSQGPHLVSIILDGENAWEHYDNDGKAFLTALYTRLSQSKTVKTVTPSEYLAMFPQPKPLPGPLFPGAWFSANYDTWIGEDEEALAWNYLLKTRQMLAEYDLTGRKTTTPENLARALDAMYLAEGSDWFWWYGADQDSGNDDYFDSAFRALLGQVYQALGEPAPEFVQAPIIPRRVVEPTRPMTGVISPTLDGKQTTPDEWAAAGQVVAPGGAMARADDVTTHLYYGLDARNLYIRADARSAWADVPDGRLGIYVHVPRVTGANAFSRADPKTVLGIGATHLAEVSLRDGAATLYAASGVNNAWQASPAGLTATLQSGILEMAVPLDRLGELEAGDDLRLIAVASSGGRDLQLAPAAGPVQIVLPDLGSAALAIRVDDPQGDDNGPGTFTYPTDPLFKPGLFDIKQFTVGYDARNVSFKFAFYGPVPNPWGSPNNLSVQTLDVYVDRDPGEGTGRRQLLPGRNAALAEGDGWDVAVWAEGWTPGVYVPDARGVPQKQSLEFKIIVDAAAGTVTLRVPRAAFGPDFDPARAGYVAAVLSQDGFPAAGVWRVRDVNVAASQWKLGGAPAGTNHTRIVDVAWPAGKTPSQAEFLGRYPLSQQTDMDALGPDDWAQIPLLTVK